MEALQSPPQLPSALDTPNNESGGPSKIVRIMRDQNSFENPDADGELEGDYMKVRLYFYTSNSNTKAKVFTDEWFLVATESMDDPSALNKLGVPFTEVS